MSVLVLALPDGVRVVRGEVDPARGEDPAASDLPPVEELLHVGHVLLQRVERGLLVGPLINLKKRWGFFLGGGLFKNPTNIASVNLVMGCCKILM